MRLLFHMAAMAKVATELYIVCSQQNCASGALLVSSLLLMTKQLPKCYTMWASQQSQIAVTI